MRNYFRLVWVLLGVLAAASACVTRSPEEVAEARARYEYNRIVRQFQVPRGDSTNALERAALLDKSLQELQNLRNEYPDATPWVAMALRQTGEIYVERGQEKEAVRAFTLVGVYYMGEDWEVIQAWKAAGDLLWSNGKKEAALPYYRDIVQRFARPGQPDLYDTIVRIAQDRIAEAGKK